MKKQQTQSLFNRGTLLLFISAMTFSTFSIASRRSSAQDNADRPESTIISPVPEIPSPCFINGFNEAHWLPGASRPSDSEGAAAASDDTYAYFAGGYSSFTGVSKKFDKYDPVNNIWTSLPDLPTAVLGANMVINPQNQDIYVFGGENGAFTPLGTVQVYNPLTNSWSFGPSMPEPRSAMAAGYYNGKIYLAGGYNTFAATSAQSGMYVFDPATGSFFTGAAPEPIAIAGAGFGMFGNGNLVVAGGVTSANTVSNQTYTYRASTGTWTRNADMPSGREFPGSAVSANGEDLVVAGGGSVADPFAPGVTTQVFEPSTNTWKTVSNLNLTTGRYFPSAAAVRNTVIVNGGYNGSTLSKTEFFNVQCAAPISIEGFVTLPEFSDPTVSLGGIIVELTGDVTQRTETFGDGHYKFTGLPSGGNYTVTPTGIPASDPGSRTLTNVTANAENVSFIRYLKAEDVPRNLQIPNSYLATDGFIRAPLTLKAFGNEIRIAFSLNYDRTYFDRPRVTCGSGDPGCTITEDLSIPGKDGIVITPATQIPSGDVNIGTFELHFLAPPNLQLLAPNSFVNPLISFGDSPTPRRIGDANNDPRASRFTPGFAIVTDSTISGQAFAPDGRAARSCTVTLSDQTGPIRTAKTSSFGFFAFVNVIAGKQYTVKVDSKQYRFAPQTFTLNNDLTLPNFLGQQ